MDEIVAMLDANVLYSPPLRDLLIRLSIQELYQARWTDQIQAEWIEAVLRRRPDIDKARLERTKILMERALETASVEKYEHRILEIELPDPDDRHVLAAALEAEAGYIVTLNLKDFPSKVLEPLSIQAINPDGFIHLLLQNDTDAVLETMKLQRTRLRNPPKSPEEYLISLEKQGLTRTLEVIREHIDSI